MSDYIWTQAGSKTIAKFVPSTEIDAGMVARLNPNETCAYEEDGVYVGCYNEVSPNLKPKPGILGRMIGRKAPDRDHLFIANGPHKVTMDMSGNWITGENGRVTAHMDIHVPASTAGRLFNLARRSLDGEITSEILANTISTSVGTAFESYVMSLNKKPTTQDELKSHDMYFTQLADKELSEYGVNVTKGILRYASSISQDSAFASDVQHGKQVDQGTEQATIRSAGRHERSQIRERISDAMKQKALENLDLSPEAQSAIERIERAERNAIEDQAISEIDMGSIKHENDMEIDRILEEARVQKAKIRAMQDIGSTVSNSDEAGDGSDGDE